MSNIKDWTAAVNAAEKARETGLFILLSSVPDDVGDARGFGALHVRGADAATFLHGQVTNEVKGLARGEGNLSARVTRQGCLSDLFTVHRVPNTMKDDGFLLLTERGAASTLMADLDQFLFAEDVNMKDVSTSYEWVLLQGPATPSVMQDTLGDCQGVAWAAVDEYAVRVPDGEHLPEGTWVINRSMTGDVGYVFALPKGAPKTKSFIELLKTNALAKSLQTLEGELAERTLEILRVEAGLLRSGLDFEPGKRVLPETSLEQQVVSYSKGCYVGQEVIARIRTYGTTRQALRILALDIKTEGLEAGVEALNDIPECGAALLTTDGKELGSTASRTWSPILKQPVVYSFLDKSHRTPGTKIEFSGKNGSLHGTVMMMPVYNAPDRLARARFLHDRAIRVFAEHEDDQALEYLEEALRLDPGFSDAYEALGVILGRSERYHEAIDIFKRLEEVAPNEPMVHTNLSLFYMKLGDKETAEEEKAKSTIKQFGQIGSQNDLKVKLAEEAQKRKEDAIRRRGMFEEVLEIDAEDPIALFGMGSVLVALEDYENAKGYLKRACEVQKDNSAVYLAFGKVLEKLEQNEAARVVYAKGIEVASRKGDLMPLKDMEHRMMLLGR